MCSGASITEQRPRGNGAPRAHPPSCRWGMSGPPYRINSPAAPNSTAPLMMPLDGAAPLDRTFLIVACFDNVGGMLDHIFLTVSDLARSTSFYEAVLPHLGIAIRQDYGGQNGPDGHPDLYGFGANGRVFFWLRKGTPGFQAVHVGFVANSQAQVRAAHAAALAGGASEIHAPGPQLHYDPRYYAAQVADPDGYSLECVYKSWQH